MRTSYKALALFSMLGVAVALFYRVQIIAYVQALASSPSQFWLVVGGIAALPLTLFFANLLGEKFELWAKMKLFFGGHNDLTKLISQDRAIEIGRQFVEQNWKTITANKSLTLANNYGTPVRKDAHSYELILFTTSQAFRDRRIEEHLIPQEKRFYVIVDRNNGDRWTIDYLSRLKFEEAMRFIVKHWMLGIDKKVETPLDKMLQQAMAQGMGMKIGEEAVKTEPAKEGKE